MRHYRSEANERWVGFPHRPGDIVISTRSKSGTTWVQMICALLVLQTPDLPAPLTLLSPWVDAEHEPPDVVRARVEAQEHRRFLKTHTPLDGLPLDDEVTYVVVGRHPLDVGLSLHHHLANLDHRRITELTGADATPPEDVDDRTWMAWWVATEEAPEEHLDRLPGVVHHAADAWTRRTERNVVLVHYQDLVDDLPGEMGRLAGRLGIEVDQARWPDLVAAASFAAMRARSEDRAPDHLGVLRDRAAFFRAGTSGRGAALLDDAQLQAYEARVAAMAPPDLVSWLHRP
ncbi:sulfotransferase domain-containing protein [Iamia majanohamensis]|uniref:Sulfotransferase domain-containing protein n=1 Tax=Iamia majanohamensis TaxID=467976 RepID=A0AAE9Y9V6_9ACTN|nr:sulfotransferase domain-containing protein [Iamia majanohamensis]WCO68491.1 sulfotransferase domain-containing protein [Iamia majanohamensis]